MKTVAAWLAEYRQILDRYAAGQMTPEEFEAVAGAFRQRLAAAPGDPLDKMDVLNGMTEALIEWLERQIHRQTFEAIRAQQNRPSSNPN